MAADVQFTQEALWFSTLDENMEKSSEKALEVWQEDSLVFVNLATTRAFFREV